MDVGDYFNLGLGAVNIILFLMNLVWVHKNSTRQEHIRAVETVSPMMQSVRRHLIAVKTCRKMLDETRTTSILSVFKSSSQGIDWHEAVLAVIPELERVHKELVTIKESGDALEAERIKTTANSQVDDARALIQQMNTAIMDAGGVKSNCVELPE